MNFAVNKLHSRWWIRIIEFLLLFAGFFFLSYNFLYFIPISTEISYPLMIVLSLLFSSVIIESLRFGRNYFGFGLDFNFFFFHDLLWGLSLSIITIGIFIPLGLLFGGKFTYDYSFFNTKLQSLANVSLIIFCYAAIEELLFRGIIFQALLQKFKAIPVTIFMSLIFAFVHISNSNASILGIINVFLAGVFLSILYIKTLSLWLPIFFHFFWNLFQPLFLGGNISGNNFNISIFNFSFPYHSEFKVLFFGGGFGIEESLTTTVLLIIFSIASSKYLKASPYVTAQNFKVRYDEAHILSSKDYSNLMYKK